MTKPNIATERGLQPHWKVRLGFHGYIIHVASKSEPKVYNGQVVMDPIEEYEYGDTIGCIDWSQLVSATWRFAP